MNNKELDKVTYENGLLYLKAFYNDFEFDTKDNLKYEIWYSVFKEFDANAYKNVIKLYCSVSQYPPRSPQDIIEILNKMYKDKMLNDDEAWLKYCDIERYNGGLYYNKKKVFKALEEYPLLYKVASEYEGRLLNRVVADVFIIKDFKKYYNELKNKYVNYNTTLMIDNETKEFKEIEKDNIILLEDLTKKED